jgi:hypothetical protein
LLSVNKLSVNELIDRRDELDGKPVEVCGLLTFEFENTSIQHFPKAEQRQPDADTALPCCPSSVWLAFGSGSIRPNDDVLSRWNGKRVRITGVVRNAREPIGCGHFSAWNCEIQPFTIERM